MRYPSTLFAVQAIVACAGNAAAPPAASIQPSPVTSGAQPASAQPDVLTPEQRARDRARLPLARNVVDAYSNWAGLFSSLVANFSPDGKRILFGSLRDGLPEIYESEVLQPTAAARAVTSGPERAIWADYTRDGKHILFLRDAQGDENHHLYKMALDGSGTVDLTPSKEHRDEPLLPRSRPDTILYTSRPVTAAEPRLYVRNLSGGEPRLVYTATRYGALTDVTADAARALFVEFNSPDNIVLFEIDVATGKAQRRYPPEGKTAAISGAQYASDGKRVFVATDEGSESSVLLALAANSGKEVGRYVNQAPPAAPMSIVVSPRGDTLVVGIDAGNHGEARVLDARTLELRRELELPLADVHLGSYQWDGRAVSLLISVPDKPADVYAADIATGSIKPLRSEERPGLDQLPGISATIESIAAFDGLNIPVNQYLPADHAGKKLPTLAIFHGGPASSYAVRWSPFVRFYTALGYAVVEPNVRGSTGFGRAYEMADNREKRADWLKDVERVNAWLKEQPWCDAQRVVVFGGSYGGYTTLMALTRQPTLWRAGVDLFGPSDLKAFLRSTDAAIRTGFVSEFGDVDKDAALLDEFSPMRDVSKIQVPLFVYAGKNDPRVPLAESDAIVKALRTHKVPTEYMVAENEGHSIDRAESKIELLTRTARFLEDALATK